MSDNGCGAHGPYEGTACPKCVYPMTDAPERTPLSERMEDVWAESVADGDEHLCIAHDLWLELKGEVAALEQDREPVFDVVFEMLSVMGSAYARNESLLAVLRDVILPEIREAKRLRAAIREIADEMNKAWNIWLNESDAPVRQLEEWGGEIHHGVQTRVSAWEGKLRALTKPEGAQDE